MLPGKVIQNYKVSHLLGSGGMGEVWAGTHLYMDRKVAVKCLHPALVSHPEIRKRFKNEAVALSELYHPNIVKLYDYIEEADGVYLVMEFVDGDALDEYILRKTGPIPEAQAIQLFRQILEGMQFAHQKGVIHRDIKPSNFMVTRAQQVKILDFGIAKLIEFTGAHTQAGTRIGTVLYMSPEQVNGQAVDIRSDIYSLGVTLFQMVTGQCPYPSQSTDYEVYQRILNENLPPAHTLYPAITGRLQGVIDKATAKRPEDRFQDCREFLAALVGDEEARNTQLPRNRDQQPSAKHSPNPAPNPSRKRIRLWIIFVFLFLLLAWLGTGFYIWLWPLLRP